MQEGKPLVFDEWESTHHSLVCRQSIVTLEIRAANTEYAFQPPFGTKRMQVQCRTAVDLRMSTEKGTVALVNEPYYTIRASTTLKLNDLDLKDPNSLLYFAAASAVVVEFIIGVGAEGAQT